MIVAMRLFTKPSRRVLVYSVWFNVALTAILLIADFFFHLWG